MEAPSSDLRLLTLAFLAFTAVLPSPAGAQDAPAPAAPLGCNGVQLSYTIESRTRIRPFTRNSSEQPFSFQATATVLNSGTTDLLSWSLLVSFAHREIVVSSSPAILSDASPFPFTTPQDGPTGFSGFPDTDLKTPIATAGDLSQIQAQFTVIGTSFGAAPPASALPRNLSLADPSFICPTPTAATTTSMTTCCTPDPTFVPPNATEGDDFLPRRSGDLTISYDVTQSYQSSYLATVSIKNHNDLGRLDQWRLSWDWMRQEFIFSMKGAYPTLYSSSDCIFGPQEQHYQDLDFSKVVNCQRSPVIMDLPLSMFNNTEFGKIPNCCRNGTILPPSMDLSQSVSVFQMQVFKMPPDLNRTKLHPPQNWKITGVELNPDYQCSPPVRVSPAEFPDPSGLQSTTTAVASWEVVCNITTLKNSTPKCCVSFSAFYNESVIPCKTCACGCPAPETHRTCNASAPALLLPPQALLVPFENRTTLASAWARLKHFDVPAIMPCGDSCGVSINWHVVSDFKQGWTSRITLFNWEGTPFADWFAAVDMGVAYDGFEGVYSFNGTKLGNNTIFFQGLPGLNYLVAATDGENPRDPRLPGKQQSVISFTKKATPGIHVVEGDGFPKRVFFNGEECSLPHTLPASRGFRYSARGILSSWLILVATILALVNQ